MSNDTANRIQTFVEAAKSKGASDEFLCTLLTRQGWPANDVYESLGQYWQALTGVSVPVRSGTGESAREAFLYLLSFSTLAIWATSLGGLIFDLINRRVPDAISNGNVFDLRRAMTWEMARIAVAFPIYVLVTILAVREGVKYPDRLQSGVRKWLTYIALLGTAGTMMCDLIWFLDYLLTGEIRLRFVLKSATVMIICAGIFVYYLSSLRWTRAASVIGSRLRNRAFAVASSVVVAAAFCAGLFVAGTPIRQRAIEADRVRIDNLQEIARAVRSWHARSSLADPAATTPMNLNALVSAGDLRSDAIRDPITRAPYEYESLGGNRYELCANFTSSASSQSATLGHSDFWLYAQGRSCFVLDASAGAPW